jgi:hypothetical protein
MNDAVRVRFDWCQRQPDRKWDECWEERQSARLEVTPEVVTQMGLVAIAPVLVVWLTGWGVFVTARRWRRKLGSAMAGKRVGFVARFRRPSTLRMLT